MAVDEPAVPKEQLTREQTLAELEQLAAIEHALIVEYLSVSCVLGHDLDAAEGGPTSPEGRDGAAAAFALAQIEMFHLAAVVRALVSVGRPVPLARASVISTAGGVQIDLGPPDVEQLPQLVDRGGAIASAVDDRYLRLLPAVTTAPVFEDDQLDDLRSVIDAGSTHHDGFVGLQDTLPNPLPPELLRAARRQASDSFEQRLLDISDRTYASVLAAMEERFTQEDLFVAGGFRSLAIAAMETMNEVHRVLVQRGLLPPFTLP